MIDAAILPLKEHFNSLDDPRAQHSIEHAGHRYCLDNYLCHDLWRG
jgi:hypothetical protein